MPRGRKKKITVKSFLHLALLLLEISLIKIGNLPILITQTVINFFAAIIRLLLKIRLPAYQLPRLALGRKITNSAYHSLKIHRKAGRPKKFRLSTRSKIILVSAFSITFLSAYTVALLTAAYQLPTPTKLASPDEPLTTEFYDRTGTLLYRLYEGKNRTLINLSAIPKPLIQATLAIEDQNFYSHIGVDPVAMVRAFYHNIKFGGLEGASTITQQLIKNSLLTPEKSYTRKIKEAILAIWAERIYSKDQILQMYFNEAPYGGSIVGIAAASQTYFGKPATELNLAESSYLAGLPASPTQLSPYGTQPHLAKFRQKEVLERMVKAKYITQSQADEAYNQKFDIKPLVNDIYAPHFVFYIRDLLATKFGPRVVAQGGLKVYTTLDLNLQEKTEAIVKEEINKLQSLNVQNGAAMVTDSQTGHILAMAGSRDYHYPNFGNYNVTVSLRQPGSSIKPVTYATAFKNGYNPNNTILDTPVSFKDEWGNAYSPVNYDGRFHGPVSIRQALGSSLNIPAVKLLATLGLEQVIQTAKDLGITTFNNPKRYGLALTLGAAEVKMTEMMGVYGAFADKGNFHPVTGILKVTDSKGNILDEYKENSKQALSPTIAYLITNILSDDKARQMAFGLHSLLEIPGFQAGVKTGTSDSKRDNWTFGYTPKNVVGVWVGNPDNSPMNPALASGITGAAPIWNKIMHALLDGTKPLAFEKPAGIAETTIDGRKDLSIAGAIPKSLTRIQKNEDKLIFSDTFSSYSTPSAQAATNNESVN